jgi:PAS domain S-box-containing protein
LLVPATMLRPPRLRPVWSYLCAPAAILCAFLAQYAILPESGVAPFVLFYAGVATASWMGGHLPGLLSVVLAALAANYAFLQPAFGWATSTSALRATGLFVVGGSLVALLCGGYRDILLRTQQQGELLTLSHEAIVTWRLGGSIESWNLGAEELYGYTAAEAVGRVSHELLRTIFPKSLAAVEAALRETGRWEGELRHTTKERSSITVSARLQLVRDGAALVLETNRDITERQRAEEALRESEERLKTIADAIPQLVWMAQPDGFILWYNRRWYEYTGTTPEQMEGWGWQSVHDPEILPKVVERWKEAIAAGVPLEMDLPLRGADGRFRWFLTRVVPMKDPKGRVLHWFGTNTDISERKQAEEERERLLKENEGLAEAARRRSTELSTIIDSIADAVFVCDNRGVITLVNRAGLELIGGEDLRGSRLALADYLAMLQLRFLEGGRSVPLEDLAIARAVRGETVRGREESGIHRMTGQAIGLLVSAAPVRDQSGRIVGAVEVAADVTERRRAEKALRESEERLRLAQQVARIGSFEWNIQTGVNRWTPELEAMYGLPPGGFAGTQPAWEELVHPEDRPHAVETVQYALETGIPVETEWQVIWPGGSVHWLAGRFQAFRDETGNLLRLAGVNIDITEGKRTEAQRVELVREQTALAEASRRAAELDAANRELEAANLELEAFSYSVSHDLRAPLRTIDGFSLSLLKGYSDCLDERGRHLLARVRAATQRMGGLIDDLLTLSRVTRREMRWEPLELSSLAQAVVAELRGASPERQVEIHIEPGLKARGDPELLRVVLTNLLGNAWKFSAKRERATIEFGIIWKNGEWIYYVKDNGAGFDMAYAGRLFGAFQRLHSESEFPGTGIGLAIVQRIVHRHGGQVCGEGEVEKGATFYFTLGSRPEARPHGLPGRGLRGVRPEGSSLEGFHG